MTTYNNLTGVDEYPTTRLAINNEPIMRKAIYGQVKVNKPIILPPSYKNSKTINQEITTYQTIIKNSENFNNNLYNSLTIDNNNYNNVDYSPSFKTIEFENDSKLINKTSYFKESENYNNNLNNSTISKEISEENTFNNEANNQTAEIGENQNLDNIIYNQNNQYNQNTQYNQYTAIEYNYNYDNLLDNKTATYTDNINSNINFDNENLIDIDINNFYANPYLNYNSSEFPYEVDSKNVKISYPIQTVEDENLNPFKNNKLLENEIQSQKELINIKQINEEEKKKEEEKEIDIIKENQIENLKENQKDIKKENQIENQIENKKENKKPKVPKRNMSTQTDEDNMKCMVNYKRRGTYEVIKDQFSKNIININDSLYPKTVNRNYYNRPDIYSIFNKKNIDLNKKNIINNKTYKFKVFFNPVKKVRKIKNSPDSNFHKKDFNNSNNIHKPNNINSKPSKNVLDNNNQMNYKIINDNSYLNYNFENDWINNNSGYNEKINYENMNLNQVIYGNNYIYENNSNAIQNEVQTSNIFEPYQNNNNSLGLYENNINY